MTLQPTMPVWTDTAGLADMMGYKRATVARLWRTWCQTRGLPHPVFGATLAGRGGQPRWLASELAAWLESPRACLPANDTASRTAAPKAPPAPAAPPIDTHFHDPAATGMARALLAAAGRAG
jgi:hypothetical protein